MKKPTMKRVTTVTFSNKTNGFIEVYTTKQIAKALKKFGNVAGAGIKDKYMLTVDARYDFDEVLEYVEAQI